MRQTFQKSQRVWVPGKPGVQGIIRRVTDDMIDGFSYAVTYTDERDLSAKLVTATQAELSSAQNASQSTKRAKKSRR